MRPKGNPARKCGEEVILIRFRFNLNTRESNLLRQYVIVSHFSPLRSNDRVYLVGELKCYHGERIKKTKKATRRQTGSARNGIGCRGAWYCTRSTERSQNFSFIRIV